MRTRPRVIRVLVADTLVLTTWWHRGNAPVEGDIGFYSARRWDS